jgi:hypothetical protein
MLMAVEKHKEISDKLRNLLRELDDDRLTKSGKLALPEKQVTTKAFSVSKEPSLRQLNARVLTKRSMSREEREAEAKRLAEAARPQYPDARCIFVQHTRCLGCGHESEGMSHPLVFLRLRRLQGTAFSPTDISYVPEREYVEYPGGKLPRMIIHHTTQVQKCHKCFTNAVHWFPGGDTSSSPAGQGNPINSTTEKSSLNQNLTISKSLTEPVERFGIETSSSKLSENQNINSTSLDSGSDSTKSEREEASVPAKLTPTLTEEDRGIVTSLLASLEDQPDQENSLPLTQSKS